MARHKDEALDQIPASGAGRNATARMNHPIVLERRFDPARAFAAVGICLEMMSESHAR